MDSTTVLLSRIRQGDDRARDELARAYLPVLRRLAHGRLPPSARGLVDTGDVVSSSLQKALAHLDQFEKRHEGAFLAYLRQILLNEIRTEIRRAKTRPAGSELDTRHASSAPSPLEALVGSELLDRYEAGLEKLTPEQRQAVVLRIEFGMRYREIAEKLELPSEDAARMLVARALARLARELSDEPGTHAMRAESE